MYLNKRNIATLILALTLGVSVSAQNGSIVVNSDQWSATDPLDRALSSASDVEAKDDNKIVAMFYWNWHCSFHVEKESVGNVTQIIKNTPEALKDAKHPVWYRGGRPGQNHHCHWGEPLYGYYRSTDPWVLRKHAEMLADAGVDVVFTDCSNSNYLWDEALWAMLEVWSDALKDGVKVPKISFILPFGPGVYQEGHGGAEMLRRLYTEIFSKNLYPELWFYYDSGKPLLMANDIMFPRKTELDRKIHQFFDFMPTEPGYAIGPASKTSRQWSWLEVYPQHAFNNGTMMSVGVAQNTSVGRLSPAGTQCAGAFNVENAYGRTFMGDGTRSNGTWDKSEGAVMKGANFQQQWDWALKHKDLEVIFVTGYNEYIAGKWDADKYSLWNGYPFSFVDQYDDVHSRDVEPNNEWYGDDGSYQGDTYYYQLVDNVRKFKGMSEFEYASKAKTISIGKFDDWGDDVLPNYQHYRGNTLHRDHAGYADKYYVNNSGRNDLVRAKVARDKKNIYFYIETSEAITSRKDENWMWLLIDADRDKSTGWQGYDYIVNYTKPTSAKKAILQKNVDNKWAWGSDEKINYAVKGNMMELAIPKKMVAMQNDKIDFEFKWVDNILPEGEDVALASFFYLYGDAAPGARFNFVYTQQDN